ncbi:hypothetical protein [Sphingobium phenoxybenzoativorans]|uniref:hypothetical protein n=1 Tax=Sphingobium phenoxybenzoativorans TaxID=1592790 RepID=UPI001112FFD8|nr:hypothetical protein [Sphingobium phenoxybenzoativorans]
MAIAGPWAASQPSAWAAEQPLYGRLTFAIPAGSSFEDQRQAVELKSVRFAATPGKILRTPILDTDDTTSKTPAATGAPVAMEGHQYAASSSEATLFPEPVSGTRPANTLSNTISRWSLDAWMLIRNGSSHFNLASYGQLGSSQAGVRVQYDLTPGSRSRVAPYARITSALAHPAAPEAAFGIGYRPVRSFPFDIGVERRVALGMGARDAFAIVASTGFGPATMPFGLEAEGYAQGGIVGFRNRDAFADGKFSLRTYVIDDKIALGMSTSGGAQPNLTRFDIGPQIQMRFSNGRIQSRMAAEWRQRITGRAQPGSGPAVTLVAGF